MERHYIELSSEAIWLLDYLRPLSIPVEALLDDGIDLEALIELERTRLAEVVEDVVYLTERGRQIAENPKQRWLLEARKSDLENIYQMEIFTWQKVRAWILKETRSCTP